MQKSSCLVINFQTCQQVMSGGSSRAKVVNASYQRDTLYLQSQMVGIVTPHVKLLFTIFTSHAVVPGSSPSYSTLQDNSLVLHLESRVLLLMGESNVEYEVFDFSLAQPWLLEPFGEQTNIYKIDIHLSVSPFQINKQIWGANVVA